MLPEERDSIRRRVEKEISDLRKSVVTLAELAESDVQSDANDWFSSKESNASGEINGLALIKAKKRLLVLNELLSRIDRPDFGVCMKCNKPIPLPRLLAIPTATMCVTC
jgi:DnaK suppressor protein